MQSIIRFSLFGAYERFDTNNFESYMNLIKLFGKKGYKSATSNELQLQSDGQARVLVMPIFLNESGTISVEITSNRINFQKDVNDIVEIETLNKVFMNEFSNLLDSFLTDMSIISNRVALNCEIYNVYTILDTSTQSSYFDDINKTQIIVKNAVRKEVEQEESNIIIEKHVSPQDKFTRYIYDINSIGENQVMRFTKDNIKKMYEAYIKIAIEIEKGLK